MNASSRSLKIVSQVWENSPRIETHGTWSQPYFSHIASYCSYSINPICIWCPLVMRLLNFYINIFGNRKLEYLASMRQWLCILMQHQCANRQTQSYSIMSHYTYAACSNENLTSSGPYKPRTSHTSRTGRCMNHAPAILAAPALVYSMHRLLVVWISVAHFHLCSLLDRYTVLDVWAVRRPTRVCYGSRWGRCVLFINMLDNFQQSSIHTDGNQM